MFQEAKLSITQLAKELEIKKKDLAEANKIADLVRAHLLMNIFQN